MPDKKYEVVIYPAAIDDLDGFFRYYYQESQDAEVADKVVGALETAILGLEFMPYSHSAMRPSRLEKMGYRKLISGSFIAAFKIDEAQRVVSVVRVFHGMRDYEKLL
jgi:toxin ParE1/3/4